MAKRKGPDALALKIERAKSILDTEYSSPWTEANLAQVVDLPVPLFREEFRARYHCSVQQHLADVRVEIAKELVIGGNTVTATARVCGLKNSAALSSVFYRCTGIHASQYRYRTVGWKYGKAALERWAPIDKNAARLPATVHDI